MYRKKAKDLVLVGNLLIDPVVLRKCLKKHSYHLKYDPEREITELIVDDGNFSEVVWEIRNISLESVEKLAVGLGLTKGAGYYWSKDNIFITLLDDGSSDAIELQAMMVRAGVPYQKRESGKLGLIIRNSQYCWSFDELTDLLRRTIERNRDSLETTP